MEAQITIFGVGETYDAILTTDHPASSYGRPVLVLRGGEAVGPDDMIETGTRGRITAREHVERHRRYVTDTRDVISGYSEEPAAHQADADEMVRRFLGNCPPPNRKERQCEP